MLFTTIFKVFSPKMSQYAIHGALTLGYYFNFTGINSIHLPKLPGLSKSPFFM